MKQLNPLVKLMVMGALVIGFTGCSSLGMMNGGQLPAEAPATPQNAYQVEMHSNFGEPKVYVGKHDPSLTVQDALEAAGAIKKYRRMKVDVYRQVEGKYGGLKMPVEYQPGSKAVRAEQNYAVHPGDRIVVGPSEEGSLDQLLDAVM